MSPRVTRGESLGVESRLEEGGGGGSGFAPSWFVALTAAEHLRPRRTASDGSRVPFTLRSASDEALGEELGAGVGSLFRTVTLLLRLACCCAPLYGLQLLFTLSASLDPLAAPLSGVEHLARLSLAPLAVTLSADGPASAAFGAGVGGRLSGSFDKRDALLVTSLLDLLASGVWTAGLAYIAHDGRLRAQKRQLVTLVAEAEGEGEAEAEARAVSTQRVSDFSVTLHGLPRACESAEQLAQLAHHVCTYMEELLAQGEDAGAGAGARRRPRVVAVSLVRDTGALLEARARLNELLDVSEAAGGVSPEERAAFDAHRVRSHSSAGGEPPGVQQRCAAALKDRLSGASGRRARFEALRELKAAVAELQAASFTADVLCAFVTLEHSADCARAQQLLPASLWRRLRACARCQGAPRLRGRHALRCTPAPDPGDVLWEHLSVGAAQRAARRVTSALLLAVLLFGATAVAVTAKLYASSAPRPVDCDEAMRIGRLNCSSVWDLGGANATVSDAARQAVDSLRGDNTDGACAIDALGRFALNASTFITQGGAVNASVPAASCAAQTCFGCFCASQAEASDQSSSAQFCASWTAAYGSAWAVRVAAAVTAFVANVVTMGLLPRLTKFERHRSLANAHANEARALFIASFVASLVATMAAYSSIAALRPLRIAFDGPYTDFTPPQWYSHVGTALTISAIMQCLLPLILMAIPALIQALRYRLASPRTQEGMNALARGCLWRAAQRIGQLLGVVFLVLSLCGGIPGLFFVLLLFLFVFRLANRAFLIHCAASPPRYDAALVERARPLLLWAVWFHLGFTAWMYGAATLPSYGITRQGADTGAVSQYDVKARLRKVNCLLQAVPFLALSLRLTLRHNAGNARALGRAMCCVEESLAALAEAVGEQRAGACSFSEAVAHGLLRGLTSYNVAENPLYEAALRTGKRRASAPVFARAPAEPDREQQKREAPPPPPPPPAAVEPTWARKMKEESDAAPPPALSSSASRKERFSQPLRPPPPPPEQAVPANAVPQQAVTPPLPPRRKPPQPPQQQPQATSNPLFQGGDTAAANPFEDAGLWGDAPAS